MLSDAKVERREREEIVQPTFPRLGGSMSNKIWREISTCEVISFFTSYKPFVFVLLFLQRGVFMASQLSLFDVLARRRRFAALSS